MAKIPLGILSPKISESLIFAPFWMATAAAPGLEQSVLVERDTGKARAQEGFVTSKSRASHQNPTFFARLTSFLSYLTLQLKKGNRKHSLKRSQVKSLPPKPGQFPFPH